MKILIASMIALVGLPVWATDITLSSWTPLYQGIDAATAAIGGTDASSAYGIRVDLTAPGISFFTTPKAGSLNTISETTSQFLTSSGAQVAINANFFAPCCNAFPENKTVIGLAVSDGTLVAPPNSASQGNDIALLLSQQNQASIVATTPNMNLSNVYNAVAGSTLLVQSGRNVVPTSGGGSLFDPNPRSDLGLSQSGQYLYLVAIDGRQAGYSVGTTMTETADVMIAFGSYVALNLDGGGSTALVRSGANGPVELNRPSGGAERYDANDLAVFAAALPTPEPVMWAPVSACLILAVFRMRRRS
jgi:exopolysaccharide biosynthesis protein